MKHIVSFSGGKDSTAMLLMMLEKGIPVDEIVFMDTGKEFPAMYDHIEKVQAYIGREVTVLCSPNTFGYYMFDHVKTKGKWQGNKGYGWPGPLSRWCTAAIKRQPYLKHIKKYRLSTAYIGIAYDEKERTEKNAGLSHRHPLVDWGVTEEEALQYCYDLGFTWGGLYEKFSRVSCWCCPLKSLPELRNLYKYYPELWAELKLMDRLAYNSFRSDYTVEQLEARFKEEAQQEVLTW